MAVRLSKLGFYRRQRSRLKNRLSMPARLTLFLFGAVVYGGAVVLTQNVSSVHTAQNTLPARRGLPDGPGKTVVERLCIGCHPSDLVMGKSETEEGWAQIVDRMAQRGVAMTDDEFSQIVAYLTQHFGRGPTSSNSAGTAATPAASHAKPSFAGRWTIVLDQSAAPPTGSSLRHLGLEFTATQDDKTLSVLSSPDAGPVKRVYTLDGSESNNVMLLAGTSIGAVSKTSWRDATLVIKTTTQAPGQPSESTLELSLDASGNLIVESIPAPGSGAPSTITTYKRAG